MPVKKILFISIFLSVLSISHAQQVTYLGDTIIKYGMKEDSVNIETFYTQVEKGYLFSNKKIHGLVFQQIDSINYISELKLITYDQGKPNVRSMDTFQIGLFSTFERLDMNHDGYRDLIIGQGGNRYIARLYIFKPDQDSLVSVENFIDYSESYQLGNTGYRYTYLARGCADNEWESKLFKIENEKVIDYGMIYGHGCSRSEEGKVIKIDYADHRRTLPLDSTLEVHGGKWQFIKHYWKKLIPGS